MTEQEWFSCESAEELIRFLGDRVSKRQMRLIACACCRRVWHLLTPEKRAAIEVTEQFAYGRPRKSDMLLLSGLEKAKKADQAAILASSRHASFANLRRAISYARWIPSVPSREGFAVESSAQSKLIRDVIRNPFRAIEIDRRWQTSTVNDIARAIYADRAFDRMPILADALMDAGCDSDDIIAHCRGDEPHVLGCWVIDLILGKS